MRSGEKKFHKETSFAIHQGKHLKKIFVQPLIHYKEIIVALQVVQSNTKGIGNDHQQYLWDNNSFFILPTSLHLYFALDKSI